MAKICLGIIMSNSVSMELVNWSRSMQKIQGIHSQSNESSMTLAWERTPINPKSEISVIYYPSLNCLLARIRQVQGHEGWGLKGSWRECCLKFPTCSGRDNKGCIKFYIYISMCMHGYVYAYASK
jgi:hypothetical protein